MEISQYFVIETFALLIFLLSIGVSIYSRQKALVRKAVTGKKIRRLYRRSWVKSILDNGDFELMANAIRNNLMVSVGLMSAIVISFGFVLNGTLPNNLPILSDMRVILTLVLLIYTLFLILMEARTLFYVPIVAGASQSLIQQYEKKSKVDYVSCLLDEAFDYFSSSVRMLFFIVALLVWFYNVYAFVVFTVVLTFFMLRDDYGSSSITIF